MKWIRWHVLGGFPMRTFVVALCIFSASLQSHADTRVWPSKKGSVIVQPFNLDDLATIEELGYEDTGGQLLKGAGNDEISFQEYCTFNRDGFPAKPVRLVSCVIVIQTLLFRQTNGFPVWEGVDAIQINFNGNVLRTFSPGNPDCASSLYPDWSVFAIGSWTDRKSPNVGGYAFSNAWVVNPETKKFKEVPTKSVKCEVNLANEHLD